MGLRERIINRFGAFGITEKVIDSQLAKHTAGLKGQELIEKRKSVIKSIYNTLEKEFGPGASNTKNTPSIKSYAQGAQFGYTSFYNSKKDCDHSAYKDKPIKVGNTNSLYCFGTKYINKSKTSTNEKPVEVDYLVSLNGDMLQEYYGHWVTILNLEMQDYGGVQQLVLNYVPIIYKLLQEGKKVGIFCTGSHGRTGTLLALLIAHAEPEVEDPVAEARSRHCEHAVESYAQVLAIFKYANKELPEKYESMRKTTVQYVGPAAQPGIQYQTGGKKTYESNQQVWRGHGWDF